MRKAQIAAVAACECRGAGFSLRGTLVPPTRWRSEVRRRLKSAPQELFHAVIVLASTALLAFTTAAISAPPRLVCLSPNLTEIVYGVGAFDQVVGVSKFASYPPEISKLPALGGWQDP